MVESVTQQLEQARDDNDVKAVILEINSPGGGITASDIIYKEILEFKEKTTKKNNRKHAGCCGIRCLLYFSCC